MPKAYEKRTYTKLLGDVLGRYCGHGNAMRYDDVAELAGCSPRLLRALASHDTSVGVGFDQAMEIVKVLPDAAATEFFAGLGYFGLSRINGGGSLHEVHYELTRTGAYYGEAYMDGLIDHREARDLSTKFLPRLMAAAARCVGVKA